MNSVIDELEKDMKPKGELKLMNDEIFDCRLDDVDFDGCDMEIEPKKKEKIEITYI